MNEEISGEEQLQNAMGFKERVQARMEALNLAPQQLNRALGRSHGYMACFLRENQEHSSLRSVIELMILLDLTPNEFFGYDPMPGSERRDGVRLPAKSERRPRPKLPRRPTVAENRFVDQELPPGSEVPVIELRKKAEARGFSWAYMAPLLRVRGAYDERREWGGPYYYVRPVKAEEE